MSLRSSVREITDVSSEVVEEFFASFDPVPEATACWLWRGRTIRDGYGILRMSNRIELKASRLSWRIHNGELPSGLVVMHLCDQPRCVRPSHLALGTTESNQFDSLRKGRQHGIKGASS